MSWRVRRQHGYRQNDYCGYLCNVCKSQHDFFSPLVDAASLRRSAFVVIDSQAEKTYIAKIAQIIKACGLDPYIATDNDISGDLFHNKICEPMRRSLIVVADTNIWRGTEIRPNVLLEIGLAIGLGRPIVLTEYTPRRSSKRNPDKVRPSDIKGMTLATLTGKKGRICELDEQRIHNSILTATARGTQALIVQMLSADERESVEGVLLETVDELLYFVALLDTFPVETMCYSTKPWEKFLTSELIPTIPESDPKHAPSLEMFGKVPDNFLSIARQVEYWDFISEEKLGAFCHDEEYHFCMADIPRPLRVACVERLIKFYEENECYHLCLVPERSAPFQSSVIYKSGVASITFESNRYFGLDGQKRPGYYGRLRPTDSKDVYAKFKLAGDRFGDDGRKRRSSNLRKLKSLTNA